MLCDIHQRISKCWPSNLHQMCVYKQETLKEVAAELAFMKVETLLSKGFRRERSGIASSGPAMVNGAVC